MEPDNPNDVLTTLNQDVAQIWDQNADYWEQRMGEGNDFHKLLIEPMQVKLLELQSGEVVLDAACGNGQFARKMADLGAKVIAVDVSETMIEKAKARSAGYEARIEYRTVDCSNREQLLSLGQRMFDRIVCTMALMDMAEIQPLASAAARLLKTEGRLVFSLCHPCFNSGLTKHGVERHDIGGNWSRSISCGRVSTPIP
jgi:2-polyprenyl-3-methyl-5-hydroxy-6-metoxy-1,4-benzoquinol methylase